MVGGEAGAGEKNFTEEFHGARGQRWPALAESGPFTRTQDSASVVPDRSTTGGNGSRVNEMAVRTVAADCIRQAQI